MVASKHVQQKKIKKNHDLLDLDTVKSLGGTKDDLDLLTDYDNEDFEDVCRKDEDNIEEKEIKSLVQKLGFKNCQDKGKVKKKKSKFNQNKALSPSSISAAPKSHGSKSSKFTIQRETNMSSAVTTAKPECGMEKMNLGIKSSLAATTSSKPHRNDSKKRSKNVVPRHGKNECVKRTCLLLKPSAEQCADRSSMQANQQEVKGKDIKKLEAHALKLLEEEAALYKSQREKFKKSETEWLKTVLSSGTLSDKQAALLLLLQESPMHNLASLDSLLAMAQKKGRRENTLAVVALKDLFLSDLLPQKRTLMSFEQHSFSELGSKNRDRQLVLWCFQNQLKQRFKIFVMALESMLQDNVTATKQKVLGIILELLLKTPEQNEFLLSLLVNKLGDPDYKVASKVSYLLLKLVDECPKKKTSVVEEVEKLLYRPNMKTKALYYAMCFFSQLLLQTSEHTLAEKLITVYFSFFKCFVKGGEFDSKMMRVLLAGVNRAYPFAKDNCDFVNEQMSTMYKIVHLVNFNTSIQVLMLLYQVLDSSSNISDRYYMVLYKKLYDPTLQKCSKHNMFLNLLYKSMQKDDSEQRLKAFAKRLLQICHHQSPEFICAALVLLSEIAKYKRGILTCRHSAEVEFDDDEEHYEDILEDSNNEEEKRGKAVSHLQKSSWDHWQNFGGLARKEYNPQHRNPLYCHADMTTTWELKKLALHYHPSVALFASKLLSGSHIKYDGDPLEDFTLIRFLDRFVFKNPKKKQDAQKKSDCVLTKHKKTVAATSSLLPVNSNEFLQQCEDDVRVEDLFFYRYFKKKASQKTKKKDTDDKESDVESVDDDDFDNYLSRFEHDIVGDGNQLDFASEFGKVKLKAGKGKKMVDDDNDDDLESIDTSLSDEEVELDENISEASGDEDVHQQSYHKSKKNKSKDSTKLLAAAEQFSALLDEGSTIDMTGTTALSNKDKAGFVQRLAM